MGSPVCGFRPTRALRCAFTRRPSPGHNKHAVLFCFFHRNIGQLLEKCRYGFVREFNLLRQMADQLSFGQT
jgi:hypothetical protein